MARILIVDDENIIVTVLKESLSRLGYDVLTASDGEQALRLVEDGNIDLLITDIVMPNMNGIELLAELKTKAPALKVIAISNGSEHKGPGEYLRQAKETGVTRYLIKPFMLKELSAMVQELLAE